MPESDEPTVVTYRIHGRVAIITLDRPDARNAVNTALAQQLEAAVDRLEDDPEVWVGVLAASTAGQTRPVFCSGMDLKQLQGGNAASTTRRGGFAGFVRRRRTKPIVAAVDGLATAGGCEIVLACDLVVASRAAAFGLAEVSRNLVAAAGGLFRLPRAVGRSVAMEAILTGEPITAERAHQLGLVARLVEPGTALDEAVAVAERIARNAPLAVWASRAVVVAADDADDDRLWEMSEQAIAGLMATEDLAEGLRAFVEKRDPVWRGR